MEIRKIGAVGLPVAQPEARAQLEQNVSVAARALGSDRALATLAAEGTQVVPPSDRVVKRQKASERRTDKRPERRSEEDPSGRGARLNRRG